MTQEENHEPTQWRGNRFTAFSQKVGDYQASRPDYPDALFVTLRELRVLCEGARVADIGAGTGLLTYGLLQRGYLVTAVEPNDSMREACDGRCSSLANYHSVSGTAEATTLPDQSVDLITAAQAFHWFRIEDARREFLRVLKPQGQVALIWNDRCLENPLQLALEDLFAEFSGADRDAVVAHENKSEVSVFFGGGSYTTLRFEHEQWLDLDGLRSLAFSRSYIPARNTTEGTYVSVMIDRIYEAHAHEGKVRVPYRTVAMVGRPES